MKEKTRLEKLLNKTFIYKQEHITIRDYFEDPDNASFKITTDKKTITIKEADVSSFIEACLPVEDENTRAVESIRQTDGLITTLQQTLLENIENVKKDKDYIKQANVINSSVNALIGMAKLQVQVSRLKKS